MWPSGKRPFGNKESRTNSGSVSSSSRDKTNRVPLILTLAAHRAHDYRDRVNVPQVHGDGLVGANISEGADGRAALLHLGDDARSSSGGSHHICERAKGSVILFRVCGRRFGVVVLGARAALWLGILGQRALCLCEGVLVGSDRVG